MKARSRLPRVVSRLNENVIEGIIKSVIEGIIKRTIEGVNQVYFLTPSNVISAQSTGLPTNPEESR